MESLHYIAYPNPSYLIASSTSAGTMRPQSMDGMR